VHAPLLRHSGGCGETDRRSLGYQPRPLHCHRYPPRTTLVRHGPVDGVRSPAPGLRSSAVLAPHALVTARPRFATHRLPAPG